ncbi:MAG: CesT family type III secretion system chaperone [Deltaproteobacteria bacterium]|nr:CesT family type III secretion system chaperone [Deltaproteobacteria bacterium]MCW5808306.1 CesT family type III secretion system chaperone [Deltaproteobacteria bacterium]
MDSDGRDSEAVDHRGRVAAFLERFAQERNLTLPPLSAEGVGSIQRGSAVVTIHVLADRGVLLLLAKVVTAPALDGPKGRRLLELSFVETGDAAFALHPQTGDLYLRALRGLEGLDYEEFEDLVHSVARTADHWDDKLKAELA